MSRRVDSAGGKVQTVPFSELRVVEIAGSTAGAVTGRFFSDHGATVLKVEAPGGDPLRRLSPGADGSGALFAYNNTGKRSLVLDLAGSEVARARLLTLLDGADVLIESSAPDPLQPLAIGSEHGHLVRVQLSPFGRTGPYAGYRSTDLTDFALSSHMYVNGDLDRPPLQGPPHEAEYASGVHAFVAAMAALWARAQTGRGQTVEVSHFEVMASIDQYLVAMWTHSGFIQQRAGNASPGPWHPNTHYRCKDGEISITAGGRDRRETMLNVMDMGSLIDDPRFADPQSVYTRRAEVDAALAPWFRDRTVADVVELFQAVRIPAAPVRSLRDVLEYEHLKERGFWRVPEGGDGTLYPRGPFVIRDRCTAVTRAPALDDADEEVLARFDQKHSAPVAGTGRGGSPLEGVRVLDLGAGWAGPMCGRILGDLGADVVRIEPPWSRGPRVVTKEYAAVSHLYPEDDPGDQPWNREGMGALWGRNRRTMSVRLDTEEGKRIAEDLLRRSDIVVENFTPRVMPNLGLAFEQLEQLNPSIVYLHLPGFGTTGPDVNFVSLGPTIEAAAGICALMGYPDRGVHRQGQAFADAISGMSGAAAALVALWHRASDPEGRAIDVEGAQLEATVCFAGDALLAAQAQGREPELLGNRHIVHAPQGCYPTSGHDRWLALTVDSDASWAELCRLAGFTEELADLTLEERRARHDDIDAAIAGWTRGYEHRELMALLQTHGIAAGAVLDGRELCEDPHLGERHFFRMLGREGYGPFPCSGLPMGFSDTPPSYRIAAPALGEFNDEILAELGRSPEQVDALRVGGVVWDGPPTTIPSA